jgi:hypothetical protein
MRALVQPPPSTHCNFCGDELRLKLVEPANRTLDANCTLDLEKEIFVCAKCGRELSFMVHHDKYAAHTELDMHLKEAIYTRRAVREFTDEPVDEKTLRELIDAAVQAPSAVNQQPWSFCVVRDKAVLARISREAKAHMVRTSPAGLVSHHFQEILSDPNLDIFYHAPVLIVISTAAENPWAIEDCSLAAGNMMLAARGAGLGTCWIGFA